jgi:hypothetical protein
MKPLAFTLGVLAGLAMSGLASADRFHRHFGVDVLVPFPYYSPFYGPYYYPYPPTVIVSPPQPQVYIQQPPAQSDWAQDGNSYWYHCDKPEGYYPYVKSCPGGWQKVVPTPPEQ